MTWTWWDFTWLRLVSRNTWTDLRPNSKNSGIFFFTVKPNFNEISYRKCSLLWRPVAWLRGFGLVVRFGLVQKWFIMQVCRETSLMRGVEAASHLPTSATSYHLDFSHSCLSSVLLRVNIPTFTTHLLTTHVCAGTGLRQCVCVYVCFTIV